MSCCISVKIGAEVGSVGLCSVWPGKTSLLYFHVCEGNIFILSFCHLVNGVLMGAQESAGGWWSFCWLVCDKKSVEKTTSTFLKVCIKTGYA